MTRKYLFMLLCILMLLSAFSGAGVLCANDSIDTGAVSDESLTEPDEAELPLCETAAEQNDPAVISDTAATSGTCGSKLTWEYDIESSTITISGTGSMDNYFSNYPAPWYSYRSSITSIVIGRSVTSIGDYAFGDCTALTSIVIPGNVKSVGNYAFYNCTSLTNITLENGITALRFSAFANCTKITNITLPASIYSIGDTTFDACESLERITVDKNNTNLSSDEYGVLFNKDKTRLITYPNANPQTTYTIPDSVTEIESEAFDDSRYLQELIIGSGVKSLDSYLFYICPQLTYITVPGSVTYISEMTFAGIESQITLRCYKGSYTDKYATKHNIKVEYLECDHVFTTYTYINPTCVWDGYYEASCDKGCGTSDIKINEGSANGHEMTIFEYTAPGYYKEGYSYAVCEFCSYWEEEDIPMLPDNYKPGISIDRRTLIVADVEDIYEIHYAAGKYTNYADLRQNGKGYVMLDRKAISNYTINGKFVRDIPSGYHTIWIRMSDGNSRFFTVNFTNITPYLETNGVTVTVKNLNDVKDVFFANSNYSTYRQLKDTGYSFHASTVKLAGKDNYTYVFNNPGYCTVAIRYNDGRIVVLNERLYVTMPTCKVNGTQITVSRIADIKVIRTAYGTWDTVKELKAADGIRNYTAAYINGASAYTLDFNRTGPVTVIVEYNNGYKHVYHNTIE